MTKSLKPSDKIADVPLSAANLLLITIADTTWRAFLPTIGGTIIGINLDHLFNTVPWWTTIMVILGFVTAGILIFLQIKGVRKK